MVGHSIANGVAPEKHVLDMHAQTQGRVRATTYTTLVDTANMRLMRLRKMLAEGYDGLPNAKLLHQVLSIAEQHELGLAEAAVANDPVAVAS